MIAAALGWLTARVSTVWLYVGGALAIAGAVLVAVFRLMAAGREQERAKALGEAVRRATEANRARAKVKHTPEAINADPHNRDLR